MSIVDPLLFGGVPAGAFRTTSLSDTGVADVGAAIQSRGWDAVLLDGTTITSKDTFIAALAAELHFPDTFGNNWDALADALSDLSWSLTESHIVVWSAPEVLAAADPRAADVAYGILHETVEAWRSRQGHFSVILTTDQPLPESFVPLP